MQNKIVKLTWKNSIIEYQILNKFENQFRIKQKLLIKTFYYSLCKKNK